jgi:hypothetical protein
VLHSARGVLPVAVGGSLYFSGWANRWGESAAWTRKRKDGSRFSLSLRWHQADYNGRLSNFVFATEHPESQ